MEEKDLLKKVKDGATKAKDSIVKAGKKIATSNIPASISWIYGLGFKVGVVILLKDFLVLKSHFTNLSPQGLAMVITQGILCLVMICAGAILQNPAITEKPAKMRGIIRLYFLAAIPALVVSILGETDNWDYFIAEGNINFLQTALGSLKEFNLSIFFIDKDLLIFLDLLIYLIAIFNLCAIFGFGSFIGKYNVKTEDGEAFSTHNKSTLIVTLCSIALFFVALFGFPKIYHMGKAQMAYSAKELKKMNYQEVSEYFQSLDMNNITYVATKKGIVNKADSFKDITISGDDGFEAKSWFPIESEVVLDVYKDYGKFNDKEILYIGVGKQLNLPTNGKTIKWYSSDEDILTVTGAGYIIGKSEGIACVFVQVDDFLYSSEVVITEKGKFLEDLENGGTSISDAFSSLTEGVGTAFEDIKEFFTGIFNKNK